MFIDNENDVCSDASSCIRQLELEEDMLTFKNRTQDREVWKIYQNKID